MRLQNNSIRAISEAYRATPIRILEVEVGVPLLGIHLDSIQAQFRVKLEESEAIGVISTAVEKVVEWLGGLGDKPLGESEGGQTEGSRVI
jgi:hypothetical protein